MPKKVGKYEIHNTLGEGTFGKVKKALNSENNEWVAIKVLDKEKIQKQNMGAQVKKEISIMKLVRHPNIVQLREVLASRTKIFIVLELVTGGEMFDKIVAQGRFNDSTARFYFQQLCVGSEYCHRQGVCHRDLKPENLLLDEQGNLKISDFGLSALYEQDAESDRQLLLKTTCGTPNYVAPEVLCEQGYDGIKADTWSIGVILFVFLAGFLPFDESTMTALFRKIQSADFSYPSWFSDDAKDLLNSILVVDPTKRWSIRDIMQHRWWKKDGPHATCSDFDQSFTMIQPDKFENVSRDQNQPLQANAKSVYSSGQPKYMELDAREQATEAVTEIEIEGKSKKNSSSCVSADLECSDTMRMTAFELINMCSGSVINRLLRVKLKDICDSYLYLTHSSHSKVVKNVQTQLMAVPGFVRMVSPGVGQFCAVYSLGRPQFHLKVTIKVCSDAPTEFLVVAFKLESDASESEWRSFSEHLCEALDILALNIGALPQKCRSLDT